MSLKVSRLSTALGAEISDIDLSQVSDSQVNEIKGHLNENMVLFFPNQKISIDEHVELGSKFGELE